MHQKSRIMPKVELHVSMMNEDGQSHFSYEDSSTLSIHIILLLAFGGLFGTTIYSYIKFNKEFERWDSPHFVIALTLLMLLGGLMFKFFHFLMFSSNGVGIPAFDIFGIISIMMADISMSTLLIMIASGWTLTFQDIDWDGNIEIYLPVGSLVVAIHLVLAAMTYIDVDAHHKYHDFSGI